MIVLKIGISWYNVCFCEIDKNPYSWIYLPDKAYESHRIICTGNFSLNNNAMGRTTGTVEFTDFISEENICKNLELIPFSPQYLTHHYENILILYKIVILVI